MQYNIKNDGKLHTRFTDLMQCTPRQVAHVIARATGQEKYLENDTLKFGSIRHDMWEAESKQTGKLPECFIDAFPDLAGLEATHVEQEFATEIYKNIILHSRPDFIAAKQQTLIDYKTMVREEGGALIYKNSRQLPTYSYQAAMHNIRIKRYIYLVEIWNKQRTEIIGYDRYEREINLAEISMIRAWIKQRCEVLVVGMKIAGVWNG